MSDTQLRIDGHVNRPSQLSREELAAVPADFQISDVSQLHAQRRGRAVKLAGILARVEPRSGARFVTLHASRDDFHASIPLAAVSERAIVIYELDGEALPTQAGGPFRFFIPDHAACQVADVDECANVKYLDHIEISIARGQDNRPADEQQHAALHTREQES